jgi:hypothetical protein
MRARVAVTGDPRFTIVRSANCSGNSGRAVAAGMSAIAI